MALTLTIGSGPIELVQTSAVVTTRNNTTNFSVSGPVFGTLPSPSLAGSALLTIVSSLCNDGAGGPQHLAFPPGWVKLAGKQHPTTVTNIEAWLYPNNPGGIQLIALALTSVPNATGDFEVVMSEWANVVYSAAALDALDTTGGASATSGTTLTPTTTGPVATATGVGVSAWRQHIAPLAAAVFTTPGGWTRLADNGADATYNGHLDIEYRLTPAQGAQLGPVLTSNQTSTDAVGVIIVLKKAHDPVDMTPYLAY
jgi:hypothetical protein